MITISLTMPEAKALLSLVHSRCEQPQAIIDRSPQTRISASTLAHWQGEQNYLEQVGIALAGEINRGER